MLLLLLRLVGATVGFWMSASQCQDGSVVSTVRAFTVLPTTARRRHTNHHLDPGAPPPPMKKGRVLPILLRVVVNHSSNNNSRKSLSSLSNLQDPCLHGDMPQELETQQTCNTATAAAHCSSETTSTTTAPTPNIVGVDGSEKSNHYDSEVPFEQRILLNQWRADERRTNHTGLITELARDLGRFVPVPINNNASSISQTITTRKTTSPSLHPNVAAAALRRLVQHILISENPSSFPPPLLVVSSLQQQQPPLSFSCLKNQTENETNPDTTVLGMLSHIILPCIQKHLTTSRTTTSATGMKASPNTICRMSLPAVVDSLVALDRLQRRRPELWTALRDHDGKDRLLLSLLQRLLEWPGEASLVRSTTTDHTLPFPWIQTLSPSRLVHLFRAVISVMASSSSSSSLESETTTAILQQIATSLRQGNVLARLSPRDLVAILQTVALLVSSSRSPYGTYSHSTTLPALLLLLDPLVLAATRRLRKQSVRERAAMMHLLGGLTAVRQLWWWRYSEDERGEDNDTTVATLANNIRREVQLFTYTLTQQVISNVLIIVPEKDPSRSKDGENETIAARSTTPTAVPTRRDLVTLWSPSHAAMVCSTAQQVLVLRDAPTNPLVLRLCEALQQQHWTTIAGHDLAQILRALSHWQPPAHVLRYEWFEMLGHQWELAIRNMALDSKDANKHSDSESPVVACPQPKDVNTILRSVAFLCSPAIPQPYLMAATQLFRHRPFLQQCTASDLANFAWLAAFKAGGYWYTMDDSRVVNALAERILDPDILASCSPMLACRILNAFTELYCKTSVPAEMLSSSREQELLSRLFCSLGEPLLSTQLSPLDFSSALYTYAKASYVLDMGIFDHLVEMMASRVSECTLRQIAQGLWACGKMAQWESGSSSTENNEDDDFSFSGVIEAPYLPNAAVLASHLADHVDQLGPKDVSQSLWALARLQLHDNVTITQCLVDRASVIADEMNAQEIANSLWGISRLTTIWNSSQSTIVALTRRLGPPPNPEAAQPLPLLPQEAASILVALGRMHVRDEGLFRQLTRHMLDQMDATSAQAIANALWAHRAVHLEPPQQLLERWAEHKLGLVPAVKPRDFGDYW